MIILFLSCSEKRFSQIDIVYPADSIFNVSVSVSSSLVQEWIYSPSLNESNNGKYFEYESNILLIDSIKLILSEITDVDRGTIYRIIDTSKKTVFIFSVDKPTQTIETKEMNEDYMRLYGLIKRQKFVLKPKSNVSHDSTSYLVPPDPTPPPRLFLNETNK